MIAIQKQIDTHKKPSIKTEIVIFIYTNYLNFT